MVKVILDRQRNQYRKGAIIDVSKRIAESLVTKRRAHYFTKENKSITSEIIKSGWKLSAFFIPSNPQ